MAFDWNVMMTVNVIEFNTCGIKKFIVKELIVNWIKWTNKLWEIENRANTKQYHHQQQMNK